MSVMATFTFSDFDVRIRPTTFFSEAETLGDQIGLAQACFECSAETGNAKRGREQVEAPFAQRRGQDRRDLVISLDVCDATRRIDEGRYDQDCGCNDGAKAHP